MIGLEEYKKALGEVTDNLSEEEVLKIRQIQDEIAEVMYILWLEKRKEGVDKFNYFINKQNETKYEGK